MAQVLRVRLPADAAQLLIDEQARLGLALIAVCSRKVRALLALLARQPLCRRRFDSLGRHLFVMGRFSAALLGRLARLHDLRRHEVAVLIAVVAVRLVEPLRQRVSKRQQYLAVLDRLIALVDGEVALLAQGVQDSRKVLRDVALALEQVDAVHGIIFQRMLDIVDVINELDDRLPDHAELHEAGIRVRLPVTLRLLPEAREHREMFGQERKV